MKIEQLFSNLDLSLLGLRDFKSAWGHLGHRRGKIELQYVFKSLRIHFCCDLEALKRFICFGGKGKVPDAKCVTQPPKRE